MRNIFEYPITKEEVIETLNRLIQEESDKQAIGDTTLLILSMIKQKVIDEDIKFDINKNS